jgi:superfamily II DNA/RNA helicase
MEHVINYDFPLNVQVRPAWERERERGEVLQLERRGASTIILSLSHSRWDWGATQDYVHRIGRTGRAGAAGIATTFFHPQVCELNQLPAHSMLWIMNRLLSP